MQRCFARDGNTNTPCGNPNNYREGPAWSDNWNDVTCKGCLKHKPDSGIKQHPNFHEANFVADIMTSFFKRLRGSANAKNVDVARLQKLTIDFVSACESLADNNSDAEAYNPNLDKD